MNFAVRAAFLQTRRVEPRGKERARALR